MKDWIKLILFFVILGIIFTGIVLLVPPIEEEPDSIPQPKPETPPEKIIKHNATVVKKWVYHYVIVAGVDPPVCVPITDYMIKLSDGYEDNVSHEHYDKIEIGDLVIIWKYEGWFQRTHWEIYRNETKILSW